jgi:Arc-like DNA binding domain
MLRNAPDMKVRLSADLRQKIENAARENNRTMNSEIAARLERSFRLQDQHADPTSTPLHSDHEERLRTLEEIVDAIMTEEGALSNRMAIVEARLNEQSS